MLTLGIYCNVLQHFLVQDAYIFIDLNVDLQNKFSLQKRTCHLIWSAKARASNKPRPRISPAPKSTKMK